MPKRTKSEFGKGLTYNIGLFLTHAHGQFWDNPPLWFYSTKDHVLEIDTSTLKDSILKRQINNWKNKVLEFSHSNHPTEKQRDWSVAYAKKLLLLINTQLLKIKAIEATWQ